MSYSAGVGGSQSSTIYPCGHMAYYDSGGPPPTICPICGARHQNAAMAIPVVTNSNTTNFANINPALPQQRIVVADAGLAEELKYPELAWLDREVSRYIKS